MESLEDKEEYKNIPSDMDDVLPEQTLLQKEQNEIIHTCIKNLSEKYQLILYLYYSSEISTKEIAACLKLPEGTVKSRLHKARMLVKEQLEVAGYDE